MGAWPWDSLSDDPGPGATWLWVIRVLKRLTSAKCCFMSVPITISMSRALNILCSLCELCTKKLRLPSSLLNTLRSTTCGKMHRHIIAAEQNFEDLCKQWTCNAATETHSKCHLDSAFQSPGRALRSHLVNVEQ